MKTVQAIVRQASRWLAHARKPDIFQMIPVKLGQSAREALAYFGPILFGTHYRRRFPHFLKIPVDSTLMLGRLVHDLFAARSTTEAAFEHSWRPLFQALISDGDPRTYALADVAHITRLAMAARGRIQTRTNEVRPAVRTGQRYAAREAMMRRKHQPQLSTDVVAEELGISNRQRRKSFRHGLLPFSQTRLRMSRSRNRFSKTSTLHFQASPHSSRAIRSRLADGYGKLLSKIPDLRLTRKPKRASEFSPTPAYFCSFTGVATGYTELHLAKPCISALLSKN